MTSDRDELTVSLRRIRITCDSPASMDFILELGVLSAIHLDDEAAFMTYEINDVATDRLLAFELQAHKSVPVQTIPKSLFGFGLVRSQTNVKEARVVLLPCIAIELPLIGFHFAS